MERLWPAENDGVIREIIPGGHEERVYLLYPNRTSARMIQILENNRFVPKFLIALMDDGMPVDQSCVEEYPTDEQALPALSGQDILPNGAMDEWRDSLEGVRHAA